MVTALGEAEEGEKKKSPHDANAMSTPMGIWEQNFQDKKTESCSLHFTTKGDLPTQVRSHHITTTHASLIWFGAFQKTMTWKCREPTIDSLCMPGQLV